MRSISWRTRTDMDQQTVVVRARVLPGRVSLFRGKGPDAGQRYADAGPSREGDAERAAARAVAGSDLHRPAH